MRIRLKIAKKCGWYLDIFSCVKMSVFRSFFAFKLEMHVSLPLGFFRSKQLAI